MACAEGRWPPQQLSASAGPARHVEVEVEVVRELLADGMRTLIREELAHALALQGDLKKPPLHQAYQERVQSSELLEVVRPRISADSHDSRPPTPEEGEWAPGPKLQQDEDEPRFKIECQEKPCDKARSGGNLSSCKCTSEGFSDYAQSGHLSSAASVGRQARRASDTSDMTSFSTVATRKYTLQTRTAANSRFHVLFNIWQGFGHAEPPPRSDIVSKIADSRPFVTFNFFAIIASSVILGFEANEAIEQARLGQVQPSVFFQISELVFLAIFILEIFVSVWRRGSTFFYGEHVGTHWLDVLVVVLGIVSVTQFYVLPNSYAAKVIRLFRLTKVLRIIRSLAAIKPLHAILKSILSSLGVLFSAAAFVSLTNYMFAVLFVMGVADFLEAQGDSIPDHLRLPLVDRFGSVQSAMFTLLVSATDTWIASFEALEPSGLLYASLFVAFVLFTQLAVMNVILGLFVDMAMKAMMAEPDEIAKGRARDELKQVEDIKRLLLRVADRHGNIDEEQWKSARGKSGGEIFNYLETVGLSRRDAEKWFDKCLASSKDRVVHVSTFVRGCMRFKGHASRFDVHSLRWDMKQLLSRNNIEDTGGCSRSCFQSEW